MNRVAALFLGLTISGYAGVAPADASESGRETSNSFIREFDNTLAPLQFVKFCMKHGSECEANGAQGTAPTAQAVMAVLSEVNTSVNNSIAARRKTTDPMMANWELAPSSGDCNDYAVTKRHALIARGLPSSALRLAVVVTDQGIGHLVLVARLDEGDFVLDNLDANVRPWKAAGYKWLSMQSADNPRFWVAIDEAGERRRMNRLAAASGSGPF